MQSKIEPQVKREQCTRCLKALELCVCAFVDPQKTRVHTLILQHPQEPDHILGSARLAHLCLPESTLKIGLSWPNLGALVGKGVQSSRWVVLHLGSGAKKESAPAAGSKKKRASTALQFLSRKGVLLPDVPASSEIDGIVLLDGTWSQAKTLWWRNPWLLKLKRAILVPSQPSLYKELRKEPRRECLSTIESIAEALTSLGEPAQVGDSLRGAFSKLLDRQRLTSRDPKSRGGAGFKS